MLFSSQILNYGLQHYVVVGSGTGYRFGSSLTAPVLSYVFAALTQ